MILYYAMGGGLGHLSRSLAILQELPKTLREQVRLLASSRHAALVRPSSPCPVDIVAGEILTSQRQYRCFLENYLQCYQIGVLVLDSFPFGIVGEWLDVGLSLPRLLIARSLKWRTYQERIDHRDGLFPQHALILEMLSEEYFRRLEQESLLTFLNAPIALWPWKESPSDGVVLRCRQTPLQVGDDASVLIVHSGNERERRVLRQIARQKRPLEKIDEIFPECGIYPAERTIGRYKTVVAAAGYNMVAIASQAPPDQRFILHPFPRRFDDQFLRLQRYQHQQWPQLQASPKAVEGSEGKSCGREQAAGWLAELLSGGNVFA